MFIMKGGKKNNFIIHNTFASMPRDQKLTNCYSVGAVAQVTYIGKTKIVYLYNFLNN